MKSTSAQVKSMYENFPYPSKQVGDNLIYDLAGMFSFVFDVYDNENLKVADLGCGTGHRLIGLAEQFPEFTFTGYDMTSTSIKVAKKLAQKNELSNINFIECSIEEIKEIEKFDIVTSTGVFHHMEKTQDGFDVAFRMLKEDGISLIWLYHIIGEYSRLLKRDVLQILAKSQNDREYFLNIELMKKLNLQLSAWQYGSQTTQHSDSEYDGLTLDVDAYLHPIVKAYNFKDFKQFFVNSGFTNQLCVGLNMENESKLLLTHLQNEYENQLNFSDLGLPEDIRGNFNSLFYDSKMRVIECLLKPTGMSLIGLKSKLSSRLLSPSFREEIRYVQQN